MMWKGYINIDHPDPQTISIPLESTGHSVSTPVPWSVCFVEPEMIKGDFGDFYTEK